MIHAMCRIRGLSVLLTAGLLLPLSVLAWQAPGGKPVDNAEFDELFADPPAQPPSPVTTQPIRPVRSGGIRTGGSPATQPAASTQPAVTTQPAAPPVAKPPATQPVVPPASTQPAAASGVLPPSVDSRAERSRRIEELRRSTRTGAGGAAPEGGTREATPPAQPPATGRQGVLDRSSRPDLQHPAIKPQPDFSDEAASGKTDTGVVQPTAPAPGGGPGALTPSPRFPQPGTSDGEQAPPDGGVGHGGSEHQPDPDGEVAGKSGAGEPPLPVLTGTDEEATEWFNFENASWGEVLAHFEQRLGKPWMNRDMATIPGELTYKTTRRFTTDEAIDELNLIMHELGYRFVNVSDHLYVLPLSDLPARVDPEYVFESVEKFKEANLRPMDYCTVYIQIKDQPAQKIVEAFGGVIGDYARMSDVGDTNQIKISALVRDIEKFLVLRERIDMRPNDPGVIRLYKIKTNVREMQTMVQTMIGAGPPQRQFNPQTRQWEMVGGTESLRIVADERTNTLIVKATIEDHAKITNVLNELDKMPDIGKFDTKVVEVRNGNAVDIANLLNSIFQQEQGGQPAWQRGRIPQPQPVVQRPGQPGQPQPQPQPMGGVVGQQDPFGILEDVAERAKKMIRIVPDDRTNALIVYANEDGHKRVADMLKVIDQAIPSNMRTFKLEHASAGEIEDTVNALSQGQSRPGAARAVTIVADVPNNALHVVADRENMKRVEDVIALLDVEQSEGTRHVIELRTLLPSQVAPTVQSLLDVGSVPQGGMMRRPPQFGGRQPMRGAAPPSSSVIPLDEAGVLIVTCPDDKWPRVDELLKLWDENSLSDTPVTESFKLTDADPNEVANALQMLYRQYQHPRLGRSSVVFSVVGSELFVQGVQPAIDEIRALMMQMDVPPERDRPEILPLARADASQVAQHISQMLQGARRAGPFGGSTASVVAEPTTNSLIVRADRATLEQVKDFAQRMDEAIAAENPERRVFVLKYSQPREVADAVNQMVARGGGGGGGFGFGRGSVSGGSVRIVTSGVQLVVDAPRAKMEEIAELVAQIDDPTANDVRTQTVRIAGADTAVIASKIQNALRVKTQGKPVVFNCDGDAGTETITITASGILWADIDQIVEDFRKVYELKSGTMTVVTRKLPGLDLNNLANIMNNVFGNKPRPDRLRASFSAEPLTETLVINAPQDMLPDVEKFLGGFATDAESLEPVQSFVQVRNGDASAIVEMLRQTFVTQVARTKGQKIADRITLAADTRLNQIQMQMPQSLMPEAESLIARLDAEDTVDRAPATFELRHVDANQAKGLIETMFGASRGGRGAAGDLTVSTNGTTLVVKAPPVKMKEIRTLIETLDVPAPDLVVRTYTLKVLDATQVALAVQTALFASQVQAKPGQMKPGAYPEPTTNTLVVMAPAETIPFVDALVAKLDSISVPTAGTRAYTLKNARADQVAPNIDQLLRAKAQEMQGGRRMGAAFATSVVANGSQLIVLAPEELQALARDTIAMVDAEDASGEVTRIVTVDAAPATEVATALQQIVGSSGRGGAAKVRVAADAGSNSLLIAGLPRDVDEAARIVEELASNGALAPELMVKDLKNTDSTKMYDALDAIFGGAKTAAETVTITEDTYRNRLYVTANRRKMRQVEQYIAQIEAANEQTFADGSIGGKVVKFVDINRGDANDILWDLEDYFPSPSDGGPDLSADWDGTYISVRCRPNEFPAIERMIRELEARAKVKTRTVVRDVRAIDREKLISALRQTNPNIQVNFAPDSGKPAPGIVEELWGEDEEPDYLQKQRERRGNGPSGAKPERNGPTSGNGTRSDANPGMRDRIIAGVIARHDEGAAAGPAPRVRLVAFDETSDPSPSSPATDPSPPASGLRRAGAVNAAADSPRPAATDAPSSGSSAGPEATAAPGRSGPTVVFLPDGKITIVGEDSRVSTLDEVIDTFTEDQSAGEVIRIFKFKYGDVAFAARIVDQMFNDRQVQVPQQPQQQQQQQGRQQGQGRDGDNKEAGAGASLRDQMAQMIGQQQQQRGGRRQQGGTRIRLATDPGHNYLIVKCEESDLPELRKLLRELDIPPGQVDLKVIQLLNLDATETAQNLKQALGIGASQNRGGGGGRQQMQPGQGNPQQQQIMQMLQMQMEVSLPGGQGAGAKIDSVEIVPNVTTNSLLVSSPPDVMEIIENTIRELEELEGRDLVVIRHVELQQARVDDILPMLQEIFAAAGAGGGASRGGGLGEGGRVRSGANPAALGSVEISGDPRSNTIIFACQQKDIPIVEAQIRLLDIAERLAEAEIYVCQFGDAVAIAEQVNQVFGGGSVAAPGRRRGMTIGEGAASASPVKIAADAASSTIMVWAPREMRDQIFGQIERLDQLYKRDIREIAVMHADPEALADQLSQLFVGGGATQRTGRTAGGPAGTGSGQRVLIMGDVNSKKLLVRAPNDVFQQIQDIVATLDTENTQLQVRRYELQYADAVAVKDQVTSGLMEYMMLYRQSASASGRMPFDAFTALPDPRTNSIMVVGSPQTFVFVERIINIVDQPEPTPVDIAVRNAQPSQVVAFIQKFLSTTVPQRGGGGGMGMMGGMGSAVPSRGPIMIPNDVARIITVKASKGELARIRELVAQFDDPTIVAAPVKIIEVPLGMDAVQLAENVQRLLNDAEQVQSRTENREPRVIIVTADEYTNTILAYGDPVGAGMVENVVAQLSRIRRSDFITEVVTLRNLSSDEAVDLANTLQGARPGGAGASGQTPRRTPTRTPINTGGGASGPRPNFQPGGGGFSPPPAVGPADIGTRGPAVNPGRQNPGGGGGAMPGRQPGGNRPRRAPNSEERGGAQAPATETRPIVARPTGSEQRSAVSGGGASGGLTLIAPMIGPALVALLIPDADDKPNAEKSGDKGGSRPRVREGGSSSGRKLAQAQPEKPAANAGGRPASTQPASANPAPSTQPAGTQPAADGRSGRPTRRSAPATQPASAAEGSPPVGAPQSGATRPARRTTTVPTSASPPTDAVPARRPAVEVEEIHPDDPASAMDGGDGKPGAGAASGGVSESGAASAAGQPAAPRPVRPTIGGATAQDIQELVEEPAATQSAIEAVKSISGQLRGTLTAVPFGSGQVIVSGNAEDLELYKRVLAAMEVTGPKPRIEVFQLAEAKAPAVAAIIQQIVDEFIRTRTARPGPGDTVTIVPEPKGNALVVVATDTYIEMIAALIEKFDTGAGTYSAAPMFVPLDFIDAVEAAAKLTPILQRLYDQRQEAAETRATVIAEDRANGLIVIGTERDFQEIGALIETIDIDIAPRDGVASRQASDMIIVGLVNATAESLATLLTEMIQQEQEAAAQAAGGAASGGGVTGRKVVRKLRLTTADGRTLPELDLERPIRVLAEKGTNSLIIYSTPANNDALREIVGVFDTLPIGADTQVRTFVLQHASAERVAELVRGLFDESKKALKRPAESGDTTPAEVMPPVSSDGGGTGLQYTLVVNHDKRTNTLVVMGRREACDLAADIVTRLDRTGMDLGIRLSVVNLRNQSATSLATKLNDMLEKRAQALGDADANKARDSAVIVADDRSNALLVLATDEMQRMIADLAGSLDKSDSYPTVATRFVALKFGDASKLASLLQEVFDRKKEAKTQAGGGETQGDLKDVLFVTPDTRSNSLVLTGTRDWLGEAEQVVAGLDKSFDPTVSFKIRKVRLNTASNVAAQLNEILQRVRGQGGAGTGAGATGGGASAAPIYVSADVITDSLLLAASAEDMILLDRWISELDQPSEIGRMTLILPLRRAKAEELAQSVQQLFQNQAGGGGGGGGAAGGVAGSIDLSVSHDVATNSIVARGPTSLLRDLEDIVRRIDDVDPSGGTLIRMFKLEKADAQNAGELLQSMLEGRGGSVGVNQQGGTGGRTTGAGTGATDALSQVMVMWQTEQTAERSSETLRALRRDIVTIADLRTNSLVVMAPPPAMPLMESLIRAIDVPPDSQQIRVFTLRNSDAEEMVATLQGIFTATQGATRQTGTRTGGTGAAGDVITNTDRNLVLEGVGSAGGREQLSFTTDRRTNSVVVAGTRGYLELAEQLIYDLDTKEIPDRKTIVFSPQNNTAESVAASVREWSEGEKARLESLGDGQISAQRLGEREVLAISNEDSNTVILSYSPRFEDNVFSVLRELDQAPPQVMIQVLILEVTMNNSLELGVEMAAQDLQFTKAGPGDTTSFDFVGGTDIGAAGAGLGGFTFTISGNDFNFLLHALQTEGSLKVLSRPQVTAMDKQEAVFKVTQDVPYVNSTSTTTGGQITTSVGRQDVGIELTVTPQINSDGYVRMEITQIVSDLTNSTVDVGPGVRAPIFFKREAQTVVSVKNNETIVLGGMIQSREQITDTKVPIFGDIPLLGTLFRFSQNSNERTELLIVLTPTIIRTVEDFRAISIEVRDETGGIPQDVLSSPLLKSLRITDPDAPVDGEAPADPIEPSPLPQDDSGEYGPSREAAPRREEESDGGGYNVPVTLRGARQ